MLALTVVVAGPMAALPSAMPDGQAVVLFAPGMTGAQAFNALADVDARVLWADRSGGVWGVRLAGPASAWKL